MTACILLITCPVVIVLDCGESPSLLVPTLVIGSCPRMKEAPTHLPIISVNHVRRDLSAPTTCLRPNVRQLLVAQHVDEEDKGKADMLARYALHGSRGRCGLLRYHHRYCFSLLHIHFVCSTARLSAAYLLSLSQANC